MERTQYILLEEKEKREIGYYIQYDTIYGLFNIENNISFLNAKKRQKRHKKMCQSNYISGEMLKNHDGEFNIMYNLQFSLGKYIPVLTMSNRD